MVLHLMAHARACSYCSPFARVVRPFFPLVRRLVKNLPYISAWTSRNISIVRSLIGGSTQPKDYFSLSDNFTIFCAPNTTDNLPSINSTSSQNGKVGSEEDKHKKEYSKSCPTSCEYIMYLLKFQSEVSN